MRQYNMLRRTNASLKLLLHVPPRLAQHLEEHLKYKIIMFYIENCCPNSNEFALQSGLRENYKQRDRRQKLATDSCQTK